MRLRSISEREGKSQAEIARTLGVSLAKVGNWFQGKNFPKRDAEPLARLLGVPVEFLLYGAIPAESTDLAGGSPSYRRQEDAAANGSAAQIRSEIRHHVDQLLAAAGEDLKRLGWIAEQLQSHVTLPVRWKRTPLVVPVVTPSQTQDLSSETGLPIPRREPRAHSA